MTDKRHLIGLFYRTGVQDCANVFDGDNVPSADDLREAWTHGHADSLEPDEAAIADTLRDAWVNGWRAAAQGYVATWNAERARREAEETAYEAGVR